MTAEALERWLERARERASARAPRTLRRLAILLVVLAALLVIIRVLIDPIATHYTRKELNDAPGLSGDFQRVHVTVFPPGYEIHRLKVIQDPGGSWKQPLLYAERIGVTVDWRQLFRGHVAASARLDEPKIIVAKHKPAEKAKEKAKEAKAKVPDVRALLEHLFPARLDRVAVHDGELLFRDLSAERQPEIWLHDIQLTAENLATRRSLNQGRAATVNMRAKLGRSGVVTTFVSADPLAQPLDFAGQFQLRGWKLAELYDLEEPATKLQTPEGTLNVSAEFKAKDGAITGGVKPELRNVSVRPTEDNFGNKLKAWVADTSLNLFSDRVPNRNAVVTVVPIKGRLDDPDVQLWPTVLGVVRNAFTEGISSGFAHLPPPTADKKEGVLTQIKHALSKDAGPPKAQPTANAKGTP